MIGGDKEVVSTSLPTNQHSFEAAVYALTFHLVGNFVCLAISKTMRTLMMIGSIKIPIV